MLMVPDIPLHGDHADCSDIDVPSIKVVSLGKVVHHARVDSVAIHELNLGEPDALLKSG